MKKNTKFLKLAVMCIIVIATVLTFSACGGKNQADDANGTAGTLSWSYTSSDKTLTISGSGDIQSAANADEVSWVAVRGSVETVKFIGSAESGGVTSIGDYAFYYMPSLKNIEIPAGVTNIGKSAFAFCTSLENITIPANVASVGERAFEGCSALKSIALPSSVTALGQSAFAYCTAMTDLTVVGTVDLPAYAFRNCKSLTNISVNDGVNVDETAFEGAAKGMDSAEKIGTEGTITVKYVLEDGVTNAFEQSQDKSELKKLGETYRYESPVKDGYTPDQAVVEGTSAGKDREIIVKYTKNQEETAAETEAVTEAPTETEPPADEEEGITTGTIVAIVIMGVVIVAIIVGAVLLMRSGNGDKNKGKNSAKGKQNDKNNKKK